MTEVPSLGKAIAGQIRKYRQQKDWSVRKLAEECARLGMPSLTESSLSNIERGQREGAERGQRRVLVEELAILAKALDVPAILLTLPLGVEPAVEVTPGTTMPTWDAVRWWIGKGMISADAHEVIGYYEDHDELLWAILNTRSRATDPAESKPLDDRLRDLRKNMHRAKAPLPNLPPEVADIEEDRHG